MSLDLRWEKMPQGMEVKMIHKTRVPQYADGWEGEDSCVITGYKTVEHYGLFLRGHRLDVANLMVYPWGGYSISARSGDHWIVQEYLEKSGVKFSVE